MSYLVSDRIHFKHIPCEGNAFGNRKMKSFHPAASFEDANNQGHRTATIHRKKFSL